MSNNRRKAFQRNLKLETLLQEINGLLGSVEDKILENYRMPKYPILLIVGCPRTASTLMMQWLATTGKFAHPTNLLSRFYGAPYVGALIQQLLTSPEFNFRDEILDFKSEISFSSDLGKTKGALAPNEFWYFWRRFFPYGEIQYLSEQLLKRVDAVGFAAELAAIEAVFDKPLALKGHIISWNIPYVSSILENLLFVHIRRHPFYNIQSLLEARVKYYGDRSMWYSFKPIEYDDLKDLDPIEQVAGQVYFTNRAIEKGLEQIESDRWIQVNYEDFCTRPEKIFDKICEKFARQGFQFDWDYNGPKEFERTNTVRLTNEDCDKIIGSYKRISGTELKP